MNIIATYKNSTIGNDTMIYEEYVVYEQFGKIKITKTTEWSRYCGSNKESRDLVGTESEMQKEINDFVGQVIEELQIWDIEEWKADEYYIKIGRALENFMSKGTVYSLTTHGFYGNEIDSVFDIEQLLEEYL